MIREDHLHKLCWTVSEGDGQLIIIYEQKPDFFFRANFEMSKNVFQSKIKKMKLWSFLWNCTGIPNFAFLGSSETECPISEVAVQTSGAGYHPHWPGLLPSAYKPGPQVLVLPGSCWAVETWKHGLPSCLSGKPPRLQAGNLERKLLDKNFTYFHSVYIS